jgi:hypothetical protein
VRVLQNEEDSSDEEAAIKPKSRIPFAGVIHNMGRNRMFDRIAKTDGEKKQPQRQSSKRELKDEKQQLAELDELLGSSSHDSFSNSSKSSSDDIDLDL